jgi:rhamnogalacturonyl hydrolase YesR
MPGPARALRRLVAMVPLVAFVAMAGEFTERFELTLRRVLEGGPPRYDRPLVLADVIPAPTRRFTNFSGDLSGRYVGALASAGREEGVASLVQEILGYQKPDGHWGDPLSASGAADDDMARLWGQGRLLIGLLEYDRAGKNPKVLGAARRLADFLVAVAPRFNSESVRREYDQGHLAHGYVCWTQNIEGLVELYERTKDGRYLDLARQIAWRTEHQPGQHSHGLLSSLRGIVALGEATGDDRFLRQAEGEWAWVASSGSLLVQGGVPEYFAPGIERDEGCSQADWVRLSLALWGATGKQQYLEGAETALFNAFFMNQFSDGDFGHRNLSDTGAGPGAVRAWWCCTLHGLRAFPAITAAVFRSQDGTLYYDLPVDGEGRLDDLELRADSLLETEGRVVISVEAAGEDPRRAAFRVPRWATAVRLTINGEVRQEPPRDGYLVVERRWRPGEIVELEYHFETRIVSHKDQPGRAAFFLGPWLLGISEETDPAFFDEGYGRNRVLLDQAGRPLPVARRNPEMLRAPAAWREVPWQAAAFPEQTQALTLRPVSEATAGHSGLRWEFWLNTTGEGAPSGGEEKPRARSVVGGIAAVLAVGLTAAVWLWMSRRRRVLP